MSHGHREEIASVFLCGAGCAALVAITVFPQITNLEVVVWDLTALRKVSLTTLMSRLIAMGDPSRWIAPASSAGVLLWC